MPSAAMLRVSVVRMKFGRQRTACAQHYQRQNQTVSVHKCYSSKPDEIMIQNVEIKTAAG